MKLVNILNDITDVTINNNCEISTITLNSKETTKGSLFCAVKGHSIDARKFIPQAIQLGAAAILADNDSQEDDYTQTIEGVEVIYIKNLNSKLSFIAGNFYDNPSYKTSLVGITGTNGKTTISQLVAQWAYLLNRKSATMGTIGNGFYGQELEESANTTGSPFQIQESINNFYENKANVITMEVSSHGLVQNRVDALHFDIVAFNNLTQDHLDYHHTMDEYFEAKALLFTKFNARVKIINIDDEYGLKLYDLIEDKDSIVVISTKEQNLEEKYSKYIYVNSVNYCNKGTYVSFNSNLAESVITTQLIGPFNVSNLIMGLAIMFSAGYNAEDVIHAASQLSPVVGRMEVFKNTNMPTIIVDYAHTPDALEKALEATSNHLSGDLWCIFGCGGDRDTTKRPLMAQVAEKFADKIIITNDNPRTENDDNIIKDIIAGLNNPDDAHIIKDRFKALEFAVKNANAKDIILLAGKGHEDYQIIGDKTIHYSDRESAQELLNIK